MINWPVIKSTAKALVADLTKLGPERVRWRDEAEGSTWTKDASIYLAVRDIRDLDYGQELRSNATDTDGNVIDTDQDVTIAVQKAFTLSVRCESFSQDLSDKRHAGAILDAFSTRLCRSSTIERLRGIFAIADSTPPLWIGYVDNDRQVSVYQMDLFCLTVDNDIDDTVGAGSYIDEIEIEGTIVDGANQRTIDLDIK